MLKPSLSQHEHSLLLLTLVLDTFLSYVSASYLEREDGAWSHIRYTCLDAISTTGRVEHDLHEGDC